MVFADQASTADIYTHEFTIACACMHALQKGCYFVKTFLKIIPRKFIPSKYTRCTVYRISTLVL